ncbi:hypothetical protein GCM10020331_046710 [Ectobacillus funiculus]
MQNHFTENIGIETVAEQVGLSVSHFSVLFKQKNTSDIFLDYLTKLRMDHACLLLETTDLKTYEIANLVGYTDQRYFSQVFKKYVNLTPSQYRKKGRIGSLTKEWENCFSLHFKSINREIHLNQGGVKVKNAVLLASFCLVMSLFLSSCALARKR